MRGTLQNSARTLQNKARHVAQQRMLDAEQVRQAAQQRMQAAEQARQAAQQRMLAAEQVRYAAQQRVLAAERDVVQPVTLGRVYERLRRSPLRFDGTRGRWVVG